MTTKGQQTSARLTEAMLDLIQTHGYSGTGLNAVIDRAGAPRGSVYFHFPDGKEGLGVAAVQLASQRFGALIAEASSADGPAHVVRAAIEALTTIVAQGDFELGCPVSVVTLEMGATSAPLRQACADAFESWIAPTAGLFETHGLDPAAARSLATVVVSTIEGAVIVSRAMQSTQPLEAAADLVSELVAQHCETAGGRR